MLDVLIEAAQSGGEVLLKNFRGKITVSEKTSHQNLVTEADYVSQKTIVDFITKALIQKGIGENEIGFIGEEGLYKPGKHLFIIDPLDGTNNFASGNSYFAVSIGYYLNGTARASAIYYPTQKILFPRPVLFRSPARGARSMTYRAPQYRVTLPVLTFATAADIRFWRWRKAIH